MTDRTNSAAPTAEEQLTELPPLDVTQEERTRIETMRPMAPRNTLLALERLACRERQLRAALRSNREMRVYVSLCPEHDADMQRGHMPSATCIACLLTKATKARYAAESKLAEKDAKIAENFDDAKAYSEVARFQRERAEAAEAKLRAVSEAHTRYFMEGRVDSLLARIRSILDSK